MSNVFFGETARGLGYHESRNPWTHWIPRLCAKHLGAAAGLVERTADDMTWEGDPRHAELTRKSFGVTGRSVATPGVRDKLDDIEGEVPIGKEAADRIAPTPCVHSISPVTDPKYRSTARTWHARCNNRRILMKCDSGDWLVFLGVRPSLVWLFMWQKRVTRTESWCDTNYAGCIRTRKSVSGCALMLGNSTGCTYWQRTGRDCAQFPVKRSIMGW